MKLSEQTIKINIPGIQQTRRYFRDGEMAADMVYDIELGIPDNPVIMDPNDPTKRKHINPAEYQYKDLLIPIFDQGKLVYNKPKMQDIRQNAIDELNKLHSAYKRFVNPHTYVAGLERNLYESRLRLILEQRKLIT
jgi:nicotinate phosphoribosyltransferase